MQTTKNRKSVNVIDASSDLLSDDIEKALQTHGGLSKFISKGDKVLLKPNFNTGDPFPASSDPEFLSTVTQKVLDITSDVSIIESSTLRLKTEEVISGIMGAEFNELGIPLITEQDFKYETIDLKALGADYIKKVKFPQEILDPDVKIILLPCLKTHFVAHFTGALKLAVGFMERKQRVRMHMSRSVPEKVAEINLGYKPHLVIMDARKIFVTKGPMKGQVEYPQKILVGTNRTEIDLEGVKLIQSYGADNKLANTKPEEVRTVKRALKLGIV